MEYTIKVKGMMCEHCVARIEKTLSARDGVVSVKANLADGTVKVNADGVSEQTVREYVADTGYELAD